MTLNDYSCQLQVPEQVKQEICNIRDSGHVWIIPLSEYIPYLFIAIVGDRTNGKSIDSAGDPVTIPAWTKGERLVGMRRRTDIPRLDYDWYRHNSDFSGMQWHTYCLT